MKSPIAYLGGKSRLAERIVKLIPEEHTCYCEPFCGAAWVFFSKNPSKVEILNDMDSELITFWRVIQNHLEEFLRYHRFAVISRELFDLEQAKHPRTLTDIQRACRYFYLQKNAFGGKTYARTFGTGATSPARLNLTTMEDVLLEVHRRMLRITIEHLDAIKCIEVYDRPTSFFYLDPPYWQTAGYAVPFVEADYVRLAAALKKVQGRFLVSLNDAPSVREIFGEFRIRTISTTYSSANGRYKKHGRAAARSEVLISNYLKI